MLKNIITTILAIMISTCAFAQVNLVTIPSTNTIPLVGSRDFPSGSYGQTISHDGTSWTSPSSVYSGQELYSRTINIPAGSTVAQVQALIDGVKKNLGGNYISFVFADGTYSFNNYVMFADFYNGYVGIRGTTYTQNSPNTNQGAKITSSAVQAIYISKCQAAVYVSGLYIKSTDTSGNGICVFVTSCSFGYVQDCALVRDSKSSNTVGLYCAGSSQFGSAYNYYANQIFGIFAGEISFSRSYTDTFGTSPTACSYNFYCYSGGMINYSAGTYNFTMAVAGWGTGGFVIKPSGGSIGS